MNRSIKPNHLDAVVHTAQQLAKAGKTPNTAMLKAKLPKSITLPDIISGLKQYQENPQQQVSLDEGQESACIKQHNNSTIDQLIEEKIASAIKPLVKEITSLKAQIKQLTNDK